MTHVRERVKIELLGAILMFALALAVFLYPLASALWYRPPNWSFEEGVLCTVPDRWVMKTYDYTGSPLQSAPTYTKSVRMTLITSRKTGLVGCIQGLWIQMEPLEIGTV